MRAIIYFCIAVFVASAKANSVGTPAQVFSENLQVMLQIYTKENRGLLPSSWKVLDTFLAQRENSRSGKSSWFINIETDLGVPVEDAFDLVVNSAVKMPQTTAETGTVIAVTRNVISEDRREGVGRYVIFRNDDGEINSTWLNESVIRAQFREVGQSLPNGEIQKQPATIDPTEAFIQKYARENFSNPEKPTQAELEKLKQVLGERNSVVGASTRTNTPFMALPEKMDVAKTGESPLIGKKTMPNFSLVLIVIVLALTIGGLLLIVNRK
jgi:hypothetical protein